MKKVNWSVAGYVPLLLLAGLLLYHMCSNTHQSVPSFAIHVDFIGEYSLDGGEWKPLEKNTKLPGFDGDLLLRGRFSEMVPMFTNFYLNHIGMSLSVNGEAVFESSLEREDLPEMLCGSYWVSWCYEDIKPEDVIEIRLHNPHKFGNANAYNEFLDSIYMGGEDVLKDLLGKEMMPWKLAAIFILVVSVALLGMAAGYLMQRLPYGSILWHMGLMSLFVGGYCLMDVRDISFQSDLLAFNTCVRQCCIIFAALELVSCIRETLKESRPAGYVALALAAADGILLVLSLADVVAVYDTGFYWAVCQGAASLSLIGICIYEYRKGIKADRVLLGSYLALLAVLLLELVNARANWWTSGIVVKTVFLLLFVFHLLRAARMIASNQRDSVKAKELAGELRNSRIVLAMSQIRTHFIFNVLTAISGMCEYDPRKADETLIRFSRYLRSNIDIMQEDEPETFVKSMEHLEDYIVLEQLRFGDKIKFVKELEVTDFKIPPLILQPVVENAIKHGLLPKKEGGTIRLQTRTDGKNVLITITDDGVGFDTENRKKEGSVGLSNVQFRLLHMMNGRMDIESSPGNGTKVTVTIPCQN